MALNANDTQILAQIQELEHLQSFVTARIVELKKEAGITTDFEDELEATMTELDMLVEDRSANEDVHTLWTILRRLQGFTNTITKVLHDLSE